MHMTCFDFQYCQKLVVFSADKKSILLCKRKGENDYDGVYSFIGGKMETSDDSLMEGLRREKNEEVGEAFKIEVFPAFATNILFRKKSSDVMILPHYYARHIEGNIVLNEEYSDFKWVPLGNLDSFEPKIPTVPYIVQRVLRLESLLSSEEMVCL